MAEITYHGVPKPYWDALSAAEPYVPPGFEREGFIHCTDGREAISIVLTQHYKEDAGDWLVLSIDKDRIAAPVKYEDPAGIFPHVYGPLNRDAIVGVSPIGRAPDGTFLLPGQSAPTA
ncbi:MAG: DUF952 domain-containing protein [Chloroflexi bacterium]|nr:MAG: DUF952 domain-containing protein [Chloroflexota bacterium]